MEPARPGGRAASKADRAPLAEPPPARWSALGCGAVGIAALAVGAALQVFGLRAMGVGSSVARFGPEQILVATALLDVPIAVLTLVLARRLLAAAPADLGLARPSARALRAGALVGVAIFALTVPLEIAQRGLFGSPQQSIVVAFQRHSGVEAFVLDLAAGVLLAPFAEELLFRGLLFAGLRQRMGLLPAALISAAAFAVPHGVSVVLPELGAGIVLALLYERWRNVFANMTAHGLFNLVGLALSFVAFR